MPTKKIHVYFMPGMAANSSIFQNISLPPEVFETHLLDWFLPERDMTLAQYALAMCKRITHRDIVLIGVSFGGILVQEMAKHIKVKKLIVISSVKTTSELPKRMIFAKYTKIHKLLPTRLVNNVELMTKYAFGERVQKRLKLYEQYLSIRDVYYLDWAIEQMVSWQQDTCLPNLVHIHGERDAVFPIRYIKDCLSVKNGTHTMIIHRFKWFNQHLPTIILE
jgi:pimeloyl-ACP methyl ester carboxylesterase